VTCCRDLTRLAAWLHATRSGVRGCRSLLPAIDWVDGFNLCGLPSPASPSLHAYLHAVYSTPPHFTSGLGVWTLNSTHCLPYTTSTTARHRRLHPYTLPTTPSPPALLCLHTHPHLAAHTHAPTRTCGRLYYSHTLTAQVYSCAGWFPAPGCLLDSPEHGRLWFHLVSRMRAHLCRLALPALDGRALRLSCVARFLAPCALHNVASFSGKPSTTSTLCPHRAVYRTRALPLTLLLRHCTSLLGSLPASPPSHAPSTLRTAHSWARALPHHWVPAHITLLHTAARTGAACLCTSALHMLLRLPSGWVLLVLLLPATCFLARLPPRPFVTGFSHGGGRRHAPHYRPTGRARANATAHLALPPRRRLTRACAQDAHGSRTRHTGNTFRTRTAFIHLILVQVSSPDGPRAPNQRIHYFSHAKRALHCRAPLCRCPTGSRAGLSSAPASTSGFDAFPRARSSRMGGVLLHAKPTNM